MQIASTYQSPFNIANAELEANLPQFLVKKHAAYIVRRSSDALQMQRLTRSM
jgi:hypothetical protein